MYYYEQMDSTYLFLLRSCFIFALRVLPQSMFQIQNFNRQRVLMMQEGLVMYADAKVKTARDTYALLAKSLATFKKMDC